MPIETQAAINWSLQQSVEIKDGEYVIEVVQVSKDTPSLLVDKVREYFNKNSIDYSTFGYADLVPFFN